MPTPKVSCSSNRLQLVNTTPKSVRPTTVHALRRVRMSASTSRENAMAHTQR
jgi:hypothetical protein